MIIWTNNQYPNKKVKNITKLRNKIVVGKFKSMKNQYVNYVWCEVCVYAKPEVKLNM